MAIYGGPSYQMGDDDGSAVRFGAAAIGERDARGIRVQTARSSGPVHVMRTAFSGTLGPYGEGGYGQSGLVRPLGASQVSMDGITPAEKAKAESEIKKMRASLKRWLKYRSLLGLTATDLNATEVRLGQRLHILLSDMFDSQQLPSQDQAVTLAQIAVAGGLPTEVATPSAQGFIFLWPLVAVVGLVMLTIVTKIRSDADDAADARRIECIKAGKCVDSGFWMKAGAVALIAWIAWDKFGLKKQFGK